MAQRMFIDHGRCFFKIGPIAPTTIDINLVTNNGEYEELDGESVVVRLYTYLQLEKEYNGSITGNVLTITVSEDVPDQAGIYVVEIIHDTDVYTGWAEILKSPSELSRKILTTQDVLRHLQVYASGDNASVISTDDFQDWMVAESMELAVQDWNEAANKIQYTIRSFPYIAGYRDGTVAHMFTRVGMGLNKERMPAQSGGISLDEKARGDFYTRTGQQLMLRYHDWISTKQQQQELLQGFGVV